MKNIVPITLILLLAWSSGASAQEKGDNELQFQAALSIGLSSDAQDSGTAAVNWGRFFTQNQEAGVTLFTFVNDGGDFTGYGGPFYRYNFGSGKTVPYVGAAAATSFGDFSTSDILVSFEGGVRWYLRPEIAVTLSGTALYDIDESEFADNLSVLFGFSYYWSRK